MNRDEIYTTTIVPLIGKLKKYGVRLERNPEELEDLVQDTLLQAWNNIDQLKDNEDAMRWLRTIMHRLVIDQLRKPRLSMMSLDEVEEDAEQFICDTDERRTELWALVDTMCFEDREILICRGKQGMTFHEIAKWLLIEPNAAAQRYYRASERLMELAT